MREDKQKMLLNIVILILFGVILTKQCIRINDYKQAVYLYEDWRATTNDDYQQELDRIVGRPHLMYYYLEPLPKYIHFWDEYNEDRDGEIK